jgi:hypothetical protein
VYHRPCTHCAEAKVRMRKMLKEPSAATVMGEQLMIDILWIKTESVAKDHYWLLIMDE